MSSAFEKLGTITFLMMKNPLFREMTLDQIRAITITPLQHNLAITATVPGENDDGVPTPIAFATFARVNDEWDAKLRDPGFDLSDLPEEAWISGGNKWLVDLVSIKQADGAFVDRAARAVFPKSGTLHIRARTASGRCEIAKRKF